jgi:hypothetical protein
MGGRSRDVGFSLKTSGERDRTRARCQGAFRWRQRPAPGVSCLMRNSVLVASFQW